MFSSRKDAMDFEIRLHEKFDVGINESFYNRAKALSNGFDRSGIQPHNYGNKHSEITKQKMSDAHKGIKKSEETKLKMKKPKTDEHKEKLSKIERKL